MTGKWHGKALIALIVFQALKRSFVWLELRIEIERDIDIPLVSLIVFENIQISWKNDFMIASFYHISRSIFVHLARFGVATRITTFPPSS